MTKVYQPSGVNFNTPLFRFKGDWHCGRVNADGYFYVRAQDQLFSYKEQWIEGNRWEAGETGWVYFDSSTVPSGEVWVCTGIYGANQTTGGYDVVIVAFIDGTRVDLGAEHTSEQTTGLTLYPWIMLNAGDYIRVYIYTPNATDHLAATVWGFKMTKYSIE